MDREEEPAGKIGLSISSKFLYGIGAGAEGIKTATLSVFLIFYYNQVLGLSGSLAGMAVAIALVFDAVTDPLMGTVSDRWQSSKGRRHTFMYAAIIPFAIALFLLFSPPSGLSELALFAWLTVFAVLTRGAMTLFYVPYLALGAELSSDYDERTTIVSYRYFLGTIGTLSAIGLGFGVFLKDGVKGQGLFDPAQYALLAGTLSLLMILMMLASALGTQNLVPKLYQPQSNRLDVRPLALLKQLFEDLTSAIRIGSFRALFFGILVTAIMIGIENSLTLHMNFFFWELSSDENMPTFMANPVGLMIGVLFTRKLGLRLDKMPIMLWGTAGWLVCQSAPLLLRFADIFPENGAPELLWLLVTFKFLQGLILAQIIVPFYSMIADVVDEHDLEKGERNEGIFFAAAGFSVKASSGLGSLGSGFALDLISWPRGSAINTAADVPTETITKLGLVYGPGIAIFGIVSIWFYSYYKLDRKKHLEIQKKLAVRSNSCQENNG